MAKDLLASADFWKIFYSIIAIISIVLTIVSSPIKVIFEKLVSDIFNKFNSTKNYNRRANDEPHVPITPSYDTPLCGHTCNSANRLNVVEKNVQSLDNRIKNLESSIPDINEGIEDVSKELIKKLNNEEFLKYKDEMSKIVLDISRMSIKTSEDVAVIKESLDYTKKDSIILKHDMSKCSEGIAKLTAQMDILLNTRFNTRL